MAKNYTFTSESVTEGHPDKVSDHISDAILDEFLRHDPDSRVAVETLVTTDFVAVAGEVTSKGKFDIEKVVRDTIAEIGYDNPALKFDAKTCEVVVKIDPQSPNISQGVTVSQTQKEQGAGDQGLMFGYATNETDEFMPLPISLAHKLTKKLADVRKSKELPWVRPDGKSQVSVAYVDNKPQRIETVVISTQHDPEISNEEIKKQIKYLLKTPLEKYSLIVVDSVTDLFSFEYSKKEQSLEKHISFMKYMHSLSSIAINRKIPIIVTNIVRTIDKREKENLEESISMYTHTKIKLSKGDNGYFCQAISPFDNKKFQYTITSKGITDQS